MAPAPLGEYCSFEVQLSLKNPNECANAFPLVQCTLLESGCCAGLGTCMREVRLPVKAAGLAATAALKPSRDVMAAAFAILLPFLGPARVLSAAPITGSSLSLA